MRGVWFEACSYPPRVRIAFYQRGVRGVGVDVVREGEGLDALSARLGVPGCMLLRANRLFSPAWLLPGREIEVPDGDFCRYDDYPCPVGALYRPVREEQEE